jgi:hypothetical protein
MSLLDHALRPHVLFDPNNKEHRQHYNNFLVQGTWGKCPYRFCVEGDAQNNNLAYAMQRMLVEYYMDKEFKGVVKEPQTLVRQKRQNVVDNTAD